MRRRRYTQKRSRKSGLRHVGAVWRTGAITALIGNAQRAAAALVVAHPETVRKTARTGIIQSRTCTGTLSRTSEREGA
jgi:hypothetical protein